MKEPMTWSLSKKSAVVPVLGFGQIVTWGMTYYLPAILTRPVITDTGWSEQAVVGMFSIALLTSGLAAPFAGRLIAGFSGRLVMAGGVALCAVGLALMGVSTAFPVYALGWIVTGTGMSASLYGAAFSTISQISGQRARQAIVNVTLFGGFASSVIWPVGGWLLQWMDWRGLCLSYAAFQILFVFPLYLLVLPRKQAASDSEPSGGIPKPVAVDPVSTAAPHPLAFTAMATNVVLMAFISATLSVYLIVILEKLGATTAAAIALAALMGPSQVLARLIERFSGQRLHPLWTLLGSNLLVIAGLLLLLSGFPSLALGVVIYGAGNGLVSIIKGSVPLVIFGARNYPQLIGLLERPVLITQAAAPFLSTIALGMFGWQGVVILLSGLAMLTLPSSIWLLHNQLHPPRFLRID